MKYRDIRHLADAQVYRVARDAPAQRLRPRAVLLFWLGIAVVPWLVIAAVLVLGD